MMTLTQKLTDAGTTPEGAARMAAESAGPLTTVREAKAVISAIEEIAHRIGLDDTLRTRRDEAEAARKTLADAAFQHQMAARKSPPRPRAQYWDDDAPGGVIYE